MTHFTSEESCSAVTSWEADMGLYWQLALIFLGGYILSYVLALLWMGMCLVPEHHGKARQFALCLNHNTLTTAPKMSQVLV